MGCVNSKADINDHHPNMFQVTNVNDQGRPISPGKIEVTDTELIFYQKGKQPTRWPLRSLRKYGFDTEVFSFECGRRCPTGHGIYAFRCRKAEQLFNMVQLRITGNANTDNDHATQLSNNSEFPMPAVSTGPPVQRRISTGVLMHPEGYLNPAQPNARPTYAPTTSRPGSVSSNGHVSPTATSPPAVISEMPFEHNNNKRNSIVPEHSYINANTLLENGNDSPSYANLDIGGVPKIRGESQTEDFCHVYMNVDPNQTHTKDINVMYTKDATEKCETIRTDFEDHCYANVDTKDIENLRPVSDSVYNSIPSTPTVPYGGPEPTTSEYITVREVNYAELDLDNVSSSKAPSQVAHSPSIQKKPYATIDFPKTIALSQSINPRMETEEGSRKTRHNSTINSFSD